MKKLFFALLSLSLLGALAFADDAAPAPAPVVKWTIGTWTGFGVVSDSNLGSTTFQNYDYNWEGGSAYRIKLSVTAADGNSGFAVRSQVSPGTATATTAGSPLIGVGSFKLNQLYGFGKFFGGLLTVRGGVLDDYSIATSGWESYGNTDGSFGGYLNLSPVSGLNVGWFIPFISFETPPKAADQFGQSQLGLSYTATGVAYLAGGVYLSPTPNYADAYFGVDVKAVKDLTLQLEGKLTDLGNKTTGLSQFAEFVSYPVGSLTVQAYAGETMYAVKSGALGYNVEPMVSYTLNSTASVGLIANVYTFTADDLLEFLSPVDGVPSLVSSGYGLGAADAATAFGLGPQLVLKSGGMSLTLGDYYDVLPKAGALKATNVNVLYGSFDYSL